MEEVPLHFSEVWHLSDQRGKRIIAVRPQGLHRPMKTRMFNTHTATSFEWRYNADTGSGHGIATWFSTWRDRGFEKIALPS